MKNYVKGRVVVVTGGSSGFGLAAAGMLLEMGGKVVITGRNQARLNAAAKSLASRNLLAIRADAMETGDWKKVVAGTLKKFGRIDVLINNHGAGVKIAGIDEMSDSDISAVLDLNIASVMKGCREVIPVMRKQKSGHIINVSSGCAHHAWPKWGVYTAAKAGMVVFTRCLHLEMAEWGGKATSFVPGAAKTNFCGAAGIDDGWLAGYPGSEEFARTLVHCVDVPENTVIEEVNVWGTKQVKEMMNPF